MNPNPQVSKPLNRREFLHRAGASIGAGGLLPMMPSSLVLGALFGAEAADSSSAHTHVLEAENIAALDSLKRQYKNAPEYPSIAAAQALVRSGEPITASGQSFPEGILNAVLVPISSAHSKLPQGFFCVVAHLSSLSLLELRWRNSGQLQSLAHCFWTCPLEHWPASGNARVWNSTHSIFIETRKLSEKGLLMEDLSEEKGIHPTGALQVTPWNTVLIGGNGLYELNPRTASLVCRGSISRDSTDPITRFSLQCEKGEEAKVWIRRKSGISLFTSHQPYSGYNGERLLSLGGEVLQINDEASQRMAGQSAESSRTNGGFQTVFTPQALWVI